MPSALPIGENRFLKRLGADDVAALTPHLKQFQMLRGTVLHSPMSIVDFVYFPLSGMVSLLTVMSGGEQIETAIVGREGVVGGSAGSFGPRAFSQALVQMPGEALRMPVEPFVNLCNASAPFRDAINALQSLIFLQTLQSAACHALHSVEQRLCRWILQSQDVVESTEVELTQESLSHMLGTHRPAVSLAARSLQAQGLIHYFRGRIGILDRPGLEARSCECYRVLQENINQLPLRQPDT